MAEKHKKEEKKANRLKGFITGVAGAAVGILAMQYYWQAVTSIAGKDPRIETVKGSHELDDISVVGSHHKRGESSTDAVGRLAYEAATDKEPKKGEKETLSNTVHWSYGLLVGGIYGLTHAKAPGLLDVKGGLLYGTALWFFGSEIAVPVLGLSAGPTKQPPSSHAYQLGAHFAYGLATAAVSRLLYKIL